MQNSFKRGRMALTADKMSTYGQATVPMRTIYEMARAAEDGMLKKYTSAEGLQYALAAAVKCPVSDFPDAETIERHMQEGFTYFHAPTGQTVALVRIGELFGILNPHLIMN